MLLAKRFQRLLNNTQALFQHRRRHRQRYQNADAVAVEAAGESIRPFSRALAQSAPVTAASGFPSHQAVQSRPWHRAGVRGQRRRSVPPEPPNALPASYPSAWHARSYNTPINCFT